MLFFPMVEVLSGVGLCVGAGAADRCAGRCSYHTCQSPRSTIALSGVVYILFGKKTNSGVGYFLFSPNTTQYGRWQHFSFTHFIFLPDINCFYHLYTLHDF